MTSPSRDTTREVWLITSNHWVVPEAGSTISSVIATSPARRASSSYRSSQLLSTSRSVASSDATPGLMPPSVLSQSPPNRPTGVHVASVLQIMWASLSNPSNSLGSWLGSGMNVAFPLEQSVSKPSQASAAPGFTAKACALVSSGSEPTARSYETPATSSRQSSPPAPFRVLPTEVETSVHSMKPSTSSSISSESSGVPSLPG